MSADSEDGAIDPHAVGSRGDGEGGRDAHHAFWADEVADEIDTRDPDEPIVIKGGVSPSGVAHLGNVNEIMRGYFVAEALRERGHAVRQVFTSDDKDPLRKLPRKLADSDGNIVGPEGPVLGFAGHVVRVAVSLVRVGAGIVRVAVALVAHSVCTQ